MRKILKKVLNILRWVCYLYCMTMGIMNVPTWFGANFIIMAMFLTPKCIQDIYFEFPVLRWIYLAFAFIYIHYTPMEDVRQGAQYAGMRIKAVIDFVESVAAWFQ